MSTQHTQTIADIMAAQTGPITVASRSPFDAHLDRIEADLKGRTHSARRSNRGECYECGAEGRRGYSCHECEEGTFA